MRLTALLVIAGLDYFLQRFRFLQRNRTSRQEVKEEYRQNEGDPAIKAKVRQIRHERAKKRMMTAVPTATVVIMNPTHFAVALKYESGKTQAQSLAINILHDDEEFVLFFDHVMNRSYVRIVQARGVFLLFPQALARVLVIVEGRGDALQRHWTFQVEVFS